MKLPTVPTVTEDQYKQMYLRERTKMCKRFSISEDDIDKMVNQIVSQHLDPDFEWYERYMYQAIVYYQLKDRE